MNGKRWAHLDSIRGLAALGVVYYHTLETSFKHHLVNNSFEEFLFHLFVETMDLGKVAVVVFFAISGFVVPFSLLKKQDRPLVGFAISRFFRLYPAYWVSIVLASIFLFFANSYHFDSPAAIPRDISREAILVNATMLQQFVGVKNLQGIYWTLQIELTFYVLCASMFAFGVLARPRAVFGALAICLLVAFIMALARFVIGRKLPVALPLGLSVMFWGLLWRYRLTSSDAEGLSSAAMSNWSSIALVVCLPVICFLGYFDEWQRYVLTYFVALGLFVILTTRVKISHGAFVWLGLISYSVYLMGPIAQEVVQSALGARVLKAVPTHLTFMLIALLTIGLAALTYYLIEKPAQALGRRLIGRVAAGSTPGAVRPDDPSRLRRTA